ncbi:MAG: hypothetical protein JNK82_35260 [Myxococcaceae bacterium]|nr:hypothetical protein [Myxococcaceae bacterium]
MTALIQIRAAFERARLEQRPVDVKVVTQAARAARADGTVDALERDELRRQWALTRDATEQAKRQFLALAKAFAIPTPAALADGKYTLPLERSFGIGNASPPMLGGPLVLTKTGETFSFRYRGAERPFQLDAEGAFRVQSDIGFIEGRLQVLGDGALTFHALEHPFGRYNDVYGETAYQHDARVSTRGLPVVSPDRTELVVSGNDQRGAVVSAHVHLAADSETNVWLELPGELLGGSGVLRVPLQDHGTLNLEAKGFSVRGALRDGLLGLDLKGKNGRALSLKANLGAVPTPAAELPTDPQLRLLAEHPELGLAQGLPRTDLVAGEAVRVVEVTGPQYPSQRAWLVEQHVVGFFLSAYQGARAELGKPTGPEVVVGGVRQQTFERGRLVFDGVQVRKRLNGLEPGDLVKQRAAAMGVKLSGPWYAMGDGGYHHGTLGGGGGFVAANPALKTTFWVPGELSRYFDGHPERLKNLGLPIGEAQVSGSQTWQHFEHATLLTGGGLPELAQAGWQPGQANQTWESRW